VWKISDGLSWGRLLAIALAGTMIVGASLVLAHDLWERVPDPAARERVVLFNLATTLTVAIGTISLYLMLLALTMAAAEVVITPEVFAREVDHGVGVGEYLRLAMLVSVMATIGGALGSALESDRAVREAAYGYQPDND
jgi:hypothetical protein